MVAVQDYAWEQGDDLIIEIVYKINDTPVDLVTPPGFALRMDVAPLVGTATQTPIFSFNSEDFTHDGLDLEGVADNEVVFPSDPPGTIRITVPRSLTLPGGVITNSLTSTNTFAYDLFLRDKSIDKQRKLLQGKIIVNRSITQWA